MAPLPPLDGLPSEVTLPLKFMPLLLSRAGLMVLKLPSWNSAPTLMLCEPLIQVAEEPRVRFLTVKSVVQPLKRTAPSLSPHQLPITMVGSSSGASGRGSGSFAPRVPSVVPSESSESTTLSGICE